MRTEVTDLVEELRGDLGSVLVAYIAGVRETRAVREWIDGDRHPRAAQLSRLRLAFRLTKLLRESNSPRVIQAWFQGMNPHLNDVAPARVIRDSHEDDSRLLDAARAFAFNG